MKESETYDKKSLRIVTGNTANWSELANHCVGFANTRGGTIAIGIEDDQNEPDFKQVIDVNLPERIKKRISELTINVGVQEATIIKSDNGGEYIKLIIFQSQSTIASTQDGRYSYRSSDTTVPIPPDELSRLLTDKPAFVWETKRTKVSINNIDEAKLFRFVDDIRKSERVKPFVKEKTNLELLEHYLMIDEDSLTNLGVLWIGLRNDRAKLSYSPTIQFIKYDEIGNKVNKIVWDDYSLNPVELIESIRTQIADWKEGIEISDGLFRKFIPDYDEVVIRELLINAIVHRPYTTRGDVFINLHPDRLEIRNPGLLPIGVTPQNILHKSVRRNEKMAQVFHDLKLMEREGSGYDKIYEVLLSNGKQVPQVIMDDDSVTAIVYKRILKPEIVHLVNVLGEKHNLSQKEMICLGLIAQYNGLYSVEFQKILELSSDQKIRSWLGRLIQFNIIVTKGRTKGTSYYVDKKILENAKFKGKTNLKLIETHRLRELIYKDIGIYPDSSITDIQKRIGEEIPRHQIGKCIRIMITEDELKMSGTRKWARYSIK